LGKARYLIQPSGGLWGLPDNAETVMALGVTTPPSKQVLADEIE
jgi:hypothetical protein